jgi:hypothetical protein
MAAEGFFLIWWVDAELARAQQHVASFERIIAQQESIIATLEHLADVAALTQARELMKAFRHSLALARAHVARLLQSN